MRALLQIVAHAFVRAILRIFYGLRMPRQITEHPCVIVANHNTHLDVFVLFTLVPLSRVPRLRAVAAGDYFGAGIMGWLGRFLFNVVLVDRTSHSRHDDPLQPVADAVAAGHSLIVFPEGSRGEPGQVRPFKAGIGELALRFPELTIQPVALAGIERTMPRCRPLPIPFNISVLLATPLRVADMDLPDDHRAARRLIATELQRRIENALNPETKSLDRLQVVSFDGDMTLWDFQKLMRHSLRHALEELRRRVPTQETAGLTIDRMIEIRNTVAAELKGKEVNLEEIRYQAFRRTVATVGQPDDALARDLNALYLKHRFEDTKLYSDVLPTFDALRPHLRIGLLSNGNSYPDRCGLQDHFQFTVFSQEVGVEKPDPAIFLTTCKQAGCEPQELMHVGDSLEADVAGANGVGAISVWLNRDGRENSTDILPDYEIRSLDELPGILQLDARSSP